MIKFSNLRLTTLLGYKTPRSSASLRNNTSGTAIVYVTFSNVRTEEKQNWLFSRVLRVSKLFVFIAPIIFQHVCLPTKPKAVCFDNILYSTNCNYLYMYIQYLKRMNF